MTRLSIAAFIAVATCIGFAIKYRKALPHFDGWSDLAHRAFKTVLAVVLICSITGCALFADSEAKRKELGKQLAALGTSGVVSLVTGNPLPAVGGAINFLSFLFGGLGAAYGIKQRHKFREVSEPGQVNSQTPVLPNAGGGAGISQTPVLPPPGAGGFSISQNTNGGRAAA
jgi:hypothetical protein